jgi:hypothetical protein
MYFFIILFDIFYYYLVYIDIGYCYGNYYENYVIFVKNLLNYLLLMLKINEASHLYAHDNLNHALIYDINEVSVNVTLTWLNMK